MATKLASNYIRELANKMANDGHKLIMKAYDQSDYNKNQTQNLHDSYGSAVFYNGKLVTGTMRFVGAIRASGGRYNSYTNSIEYGRDEIKDFFNTYKAPEGLTLVIAVAMFYAGILEAGKSPLRHKYKVISMVGDDIEMLASKIDGARKEQIGYGK